MSEEVHDPATVGEKRDAGHGHSRGLWAGCCSFFEGRAVCVLRWADSRIACADRRRVTADDWDEYEDEDDPGYVREDIRGQDAFAARELDASDRGRQPACHGPLPPGHGPLRAGAPSLAW